MRGDTSLSNRARRVAAIVTAFTFLCQNFAWAVCADGSTFPPGGFTIGSAAMVNWSAGTFTGTGGSIFVPDNSVFEHNSPGEPVTGGGHNWAFDQGATLCKAIDIGPAGGTPTGWTLPPFNLADCIILPTPGPGAPDIPYQGEAITPSCNPALPSQPGVPIQPIPGSTNSGARFPMVLPPRGNPPPLTCSWPATGAAYLQFRW